MKETILTVFIGKLGSIYKATYDWEGDKLVQFKVTEFPLSPMKALLRRGKYVNVPVMGGDYSDVPMFDLPRYDALNSEVTDKKIRIVFSDLKHGKGYYILEKIPFLNENFKNTANLEMMKKMAEHHYDELNNLTRELHPDEQKRKMMKELSTSQEARKKIYGPGDYLGRFNK